MNKQLKTIIDKQFAFNQGKNLLLGGEARALHFVDETIRLVSGPRELNLGSVDRLIDYATEKVLEECCRLNQYYSFNPQAKKGLRNVYRDLYVSILSGNSSVETIEKNHYHNLKQWLVQTNPFAAKIYSGAGTDLRPVACSEYTADIQIALLRIDAGTVMEPVLDIGCGKRGNLVKHLCEQGIDAKGIDRFTFSNDKLIRSDWLEFDYGVEKWGTISSNIGFSNHFKHHHLRKDGNYLEYGKKYMEILKSLQVGGSFHYAPDLPFVESYLDDTQYQIKKYAIGKFDFKTTVVKRLK